MSRTTEETDSIDIVDDDGIMWSVDYTYCITCIREGNYSSAALDPDEYFGIFEYNLYSIDSVYDSENDIELEDCPQWIHTIVEDHVDNMN